MRWWGVTFFIILIYCAFSFDIFNFFFLIILILWFIVVLFFMIFINFFYTFLTFLFDTLTIFFTVTLKIYYLFLYFFKIDFNVMNMNFMYKFLSAKIFVLLVLINTIKHHFIVHNNINVNLINWKIQKLLLIVLMPIDAKLSVIANSLLKPIKLLWAYITTTSKHREKSCVIFVKIYHADIF